MERKKRILFVGEASFLHTGFSTYYRELLPRLVETGKYEIAELGSYARQDDPRVAEFIDGRWKFYGTMPTTPEEQQVFSQPNPHPRTRGQNTNQFGEWKFEGACADFQPDIVVDIRDWWMLEFQERSVFRDWFKWVVMPTVDAEPQQEEWVQTYENANVVLCYSDYGIHTLRRQTSQIPTQQGVRPKMKILPKPMRPGVDLATFKPIVKADAKAHFNLTSENVVIGTVMRNQSRKLYPDLIDAFSRMKIKYKGDDAVDKAVLMIHSSWPDNAHSFDYPRHVMRLDSYEWMENARKGIRGDVLQSMKCGACGETSITFAIHLWNRPLEGGRIKLPCPHCGAQECSPPNTSLGYTREELASLYNAMDIYVQCSICEGDGMPIQEAKACGVPTLVVDYTAMAEKGRFPAEYSHLKESGISAEEYGCHKGGGSIEVDRYYYEPETSCKRALPNIDQLADKLHEWVTDTALRQKLSGEARKCVEDNYDWNELWKQWEFVLDQIKPLDRENTWDSPIVTAPTVDSKPVPDGLTDEQFVDWLYTDVLEYPAIDPAGAKMWLQHLAGGTSRDNLLQQFIAIGNQQADSDRRRQDVRAAIAGQQPSAPQAATNQEWV